LKKAKAKTRRNWWFMPLKTGWWSCEEAGSQESGVGRPETEKVIYFMSLVVIDRI
jgi:hypothetical protein